MALVRRVLLKYALTADPRKLEMALDKVDDKLKSLDRAVQQGVNLEDSRAYDTYTTLVDDLRSILWFVTKQLDLDDAAHIKRSVPNLITITKYGILPSQAIEAGGVNLFVKALREVGELREGFGESLVQHMYMQGRP